VWRRGRRASRCGGSHIKRARNRGERYGEQRYIKERETPGLKRDRHLKDLLTRAAQFFIFRLSICCCMICTHLLIKIAILKGLQTSSHHIQL
jgi:hypothetical protein